MRVTPRNPPVRRSGWWPAPRFDSPSAFSALLDDDAGHWSVGPAGRFEAQRRYLQGTLVLETMMRCASGKLRLTDAFGAGSGRPSSRDRP